MWPAAYSNVIGVGATDDFYVRAPWSNYGNALVSLAAPGTDVITMYPKNHYAMVSGTSFSAPLVAGGAALLVDLNKKTDEAAAAVRPLACQADRPGIGSGRVGSVSGLHQLAEENQRQQRRTIDTNNNI